MGKRRSVVVLALVMAAAVVALSGCGSSSSDTSGSSTGSAEGSKSGDESSSPGVTAAAKVVAEYEKQPNGIGITEALSKRPPSGLHVADLNCPVSSCTVLEEGVKKAAEALDWSVKVFPEGSNQESLRSAWANALQTDPDGIIGTALQNELVEKEIGEAQARKIPYVGVAIPDPVGDGMIANAGGPAGLELSGELMADWIVADAKEPVTVALLVDPSETIFHIVEQGFDRALKATCPECEIEVVNVSVANIGKTIPQEVVSLVQRSPDLHYIASTLSEFLIGVPQALSSVGIPQDEVKIATRDASTEDTENIAEGNYIAAAVGEEVSSLGWRALDALARNSVGDPVGPVAELPGQHELFTTQNNPDPSEPFTLPGYEEEFEKLWHVGG